MAFVPGGQEPTSEEMKAALAQRNERFKRDADPALMRRLGRWEEQRGLPRPRSLPYALRPQPTHFDDVLHDWHTGYLGVRGEINTSYELTRDLKQCVPQSILRDLYRPVRTFFIEPERHDLGLLGARALAEILKEARAALVREPMPEIAPSLLVVVSEQARRRRFLATPWQTLRADTAPRRYSDQDHVRYLEAGEDGTLRPAATDEDEAMPGRRGEGDGEGEGENLAAESPGFPTGALRRPGRRAP